METEAFFPLSLVQKDIYYEQELYPNTPIYNIGAKIEIRGQVDTCAMSAAYQQLIQSHDAFRITLVERNGEPFLQFQEGNIPQLEIVDFSENDSPQEYAERYMQEQFRKPFDLLSEKILHVFRLIKVEETFYYLFSVYHHIITDGWGTSLMFQRFTELYNHQVQPEKESPKYPYSYIDFINNSLQYYGSSQYVEDEAYWKTTFKSIPEVLIRARKVRTGEPVTFESSRSSTWISRQRYGKLEQIAKDCGASVFHVLLALLNTYLGRRYNSNNVVIGLPVLNRNSRAFRNTVGLFMSITPLRMDLDFEEGFGELVRRIRNQLRADYRHQGFPLGHIRKNLSGHAGKELFTIMLSYEKHDYARAFGNTVTRVIPMTHGAERVGLSLYVREFEEDSDVKIDFDYNLDYFDQDDIEKVIEYFQIMIDEVIQHPGIRLKDIGYLSQYEYHQVIYTFNETAHDFPERKTLADLFSDCALQYAGKVAVEDPMQQFTYRELNEWSGQLAHFLQSNLSIGQGQVVAILMDRSCAQVATMLGVIRTGAAYIPLDPSFPADRLRYILEQSQSSLLIADETRLSMLQPGGIRVLTTDTLQQAVHSLRTPEQVSGATPEGLAYVIYTSGSTGKPKGVEITHRAVVNFLTSMQRLPGMGRDDRLLAVTTHSFDISVLEIFLPLITGGSVFIAVEDTIREPDLLIKLMNTYQPTIMQATPGLWHMLIEAGWTGDKRLKVLCGGETLNHALGKMLIKYTGSLWNMYGPTETTVWSSVKEVKQESDIGSIGLPINNTSFYILDEYRKPVPVGVAGEIYIGGEGLAKGYRFQEQLTSQRFIPHPFLPGKKIYHTGDAGRWLPNGEIAFLGRVDAQVKIRGYRIELPEIEKNLLDLPGIDAAVVVCRNRGESDAILLAYIVGVNPLPESRIIESLKKLLPSYMIPSIFVHMDELPQTPNGKVDRKALAGREVSFPPAHLWHEAPAGSTEEQLAAVWKELLNIHDISATADFFSLGGHSLKAGELVGKIYSLFGVRLRLRQVFAAPTIRAQALVIASAKKECYRPIDQAPAVACYQLSPQQQRLWMLAQTTDGLIAYNMAAAFLLEGQLNEGALQNAIDDLVTRHEVLRTVFMEKDGKPWQYILPPLTLPVRIDACHTTGEQPCQELIKQLFLVKLDLEKGPLVKISLVKDPAGNTYFVFVIHHLICDGWSLNILIRELIVSYEAHCRGRVPTATPLDLQYKDYVHWFRKQLAEGGLEPQRAYWVEQFRGYSGNSILPLDRKPATPFAYKGASIPFQLEAPTVTKLRELGQSNDATFFMVLAAAVNAALYNWTGHMEICIGTAVSGRQHPDLLQQMGFYVNTLPLFTLLDPDETFASLLHKVKQTCLDALENQQYPFDQLLEELGYKKSSGVHPLFETMLILQNAGEERGHIPGFAGLTFMPYTVEQEISRLPISIDVTDGSNGLEGNIIYNSHLFMKESILLFSERIKKIIALALANPGRSIKDHSARPDVEQAILAATIQIPLNF
jgi:surfactin family lipopeptide synthetase A